MDTYKEFIEVGTVEDGFHCEVTLHGRVTTAKVTVGKAQAALSYHCETNLFIVSNIQIQLSGTSQPYSAKDNNIKIISNWRPKASDLEPKTYKYNLPPVPNLQNHSSLRE